MVKRFLGVHRIKNDVPLSAFRNPSTSVKKFCEVPVDHYFTLQAIPGFRTDFMFVTALKEHNINNPLDLVNYLRYATRGRRRLGVNVMASISSKKLLKKAGCVRKGHTRRPRYASPSSKQNFTTGLRI